MIKNMEVLKINNVTQTLYAKGQAADLPVLLLIHGGPGATLMPYSHILKRLEEEFILVYWDQRGAGKSFTSDIDPKDMQINTFIEDGLEVIEYLKDKYKKKKIFIAGHSWGSIIGIKIAQLIPESLYAYISIAQVVNYQQGLQVSYRFALSESKARDFEIMHTRLMKMGQPPYHSLQDIFTLSGIIYELGGAYHQQVDLEAIMSQNPIYSAEDIEKINRGMQFSAECLIEEIVKLDLVQEGILTFEIPVYFISGRYDYFSPNEVTEQYYKMVKAPDKAMHYCENAAHFSYVEEPEGFMEILIKIKATYFQGVPYGNH